MERKATQVSASKHSLMRGKNTRLILEMFRKDNFSTYQVAKTLGLSSGGAKKLVDDIASGGIIKRVPSVRESQHGRMPLTYGLNPEYCGIVIINFADFSMTLVDLCGKIRDRIDLEPSTSIRDEYIFYTAGRLKSLLAKPENMGYSLAAMSIAYIGKLHIDTYENYFSGTFEHCTINLYNYFTKEFGVEVILRNDLHFAILAERQHGILNGLETSCCYMQIGRGCACSFLINDKLYVGASGLAGEVGHNTLLGSGGVWENYIDWASAKTFIKEKIKNGGQSMLDSERFTRSEAISAYKDGDAIVVSVIDEMAENAGVMLKNLTQLMDFDVIILSGVMIDFGERYYQKLTEKFFSYGYAHVKIVISSLGEKSIDLGALELARDVIFTKFTESRLKNSETASEA